MNNFIYNFKYWFRHWRAFQKIAMRYHCWKPRFIFHDIEKPFFQIFLKHATVTRIHRKLNRHHVDFLFPKYRDYLGMVIDWECARFTKPNEPLNARQTMETYYPELKNKINPILNKLHL